MPLPLDPYWATGMTVAQWIHQAKRRLEGAGIDSPSLEAQVLAAHALGLGRSEVLARSGDEAPEEIAESLLARREGHEPLAYILGWREFFGRRFLVSPAVLIPRQETETLAEAALEFLRREPTSSVLDLGTGSGCLAVTIRLESPSSMVTAADVSEEALAVARANSKALGADVRFRSSDGFLELSGERFDLIVTNPPYVGLHEALPPEVRDFEPPEALFSGHTGLEFYEKLAESAAEHLNDGGKLMMEVGYRQADQVALIFESCGWHVEEIRKDLTGVDRVVVVQPVTA